MMQPNPQNQMAEQQKKAEEAEKMRKDLVEKIFEPPALERLNRLALVKPEKVRAPPPHGTCAVAAPTTCYLLPASWLSRCMRMRVNMRFSLYSARARNPAAISDVPRNARPLSFCAGQAG